jgi:hypothetical protein
MNPQEIQTIVKANLVPLKRKRMALKKNMMKQKMLTRTILMEFRLPRCRKKLECQNMTLPLQSCWVLRYHADWNLRKGKHGRKPFMIKKKGCKEKSDSATGKGVDNSSNNDKKGEFIFVVLLFRYLSCHAAINYSVIAVHI